MGLFDHFPYTNFHELNLTWILNALKEIQTTMDQFVAINALKYADPIQWNIVSQYEKNTIVIDPLTGTAYISVQPVPSGVIITNTDYWSVVFDLGSFVVRAAKNFTDKYEDATTLTATFPSNINDWLIWGDTLYLVISSIVAGDQYVEGSNIIHFTAEDVIGHIQELNTTDKSNLVAAVNELVQDLINEANRVNAITGDLDDLNTIDKSNLVAAINEVLQALTDNTQAIIEIIGDLNNLPTTDKSSIVNSIIELHNDIASYDIHNVKDYGAIGDGITDDSTAIQNALNDGDIVYFPEGTYRVEQTLRPKSNTLILGNNAKIFKAVNGHLFIFYSISDDQEYKNITFDNLEIYSDNVYTGPCIGFGQSDDPTDIKCDNIVIKNMMFHSLNGRAIDILYGSAATFRVHPYGKIVIDNCYIYDIQAIGICCSGASVDISRCWVVDCALECITIDNGCRDVNITHNKLVGRGGGYGCIGSGEEADNVNISENIISNTTMPCISAGNINGTKDYIGLIIADNLLIGGTNSINLDCGWNMAAVISGNFMNGHTGKPVAINGSNAGAYIDIKSNEVPNWTDADKLSILKYLNNHDLSLKVALDSYYNAGFTPITDRSFMMINGKSIVLTLWFNAATYNNGDIPVSLAGLFKAITENDTFIGSVNNEAILRTNGDIQLYGSDYTSLTGDYAATITANI